MSNAPTSNGSTPMSGTATPNTASSASASQSHAATSPLDLDTHDRSMDGCQLALLSLQSKTIEALTQSVLTRHLVTRQMRSYLHRLGLEAGVEAMPVIHVAGTKGKGSTSAFTERICREQGLTTALYTSPHLVHITERFRINGAPISDELFLSHFWSVWDGLISTKHLAEEHPPIPSYFRFLTLVAFHLFVHCQPKIDVVVLEVGMGGKLDATNIMQRPVVCGIASIGFDHMEVLGYTLTEIAHEKAGIIKPQVPVYSVANQAQDVKDVFTEVAANEKAASLTFVNSLPDTIELGLAGQHQYENAGLACALAHEFLRDRANRLNDASYPKELDPTHLPDSYLSALKQTSWPGRCQRLSHPSPELKDRITFFIDGAHTDASMKIACRWIQSIELEERRKQANPKQHILLFNCSHVRDSIELMIPLVELGYPNSTNLAASPSSSSNGPTSPSSTIPPIHFTRLICTPFDHDRPHLNSAPTFERLLQNYLLQQQRRSRTSVNRKESGATTTTKLTNSSALSQTIHPILRHYLTQQFGFPSTTHDQDDVSLITAANHTISQLVTRYAVSNLVLTPPPASNTVAPPTLNSTSTSTDSTPYHTWQMTLFQVWRFLTEAFAYEHNQTNHTAQPSTNDPSTHTHQNASTTSSHLSPSIQSTTACTYAPSVHEAINLIEQLALSSDSATHNHLSVFVTGSLYIAGNVLQRMCFRV